MCIRDSVKDVTKLLLELGTGFAFLGNQYHLNVGGDDFYICLLYTSDYSAFCRAYRRQFGQPPSSAR